MANPLSTLLTSERESQIEKDNANLLNKLEVIKKKGTQNGGLTSVSISQPQITTFCTVTSFKISELQYPT